MFNIPLQSQKKEEEKGDKPDFKGNGAAVWINEDKNGQEYLTIRLAGHNSVAVFPNEDKQ